MKYRRLGKTDLQVSVVGVGTWQFGGEWGQNFSESEASDILSAAKDEGINLIDTAECYGDHLSEELVGAAIEKERDRWIVATKFGHRYTGFLKRDQLWTAADVQKQLEDSLRALRTDHVDLYQFHSGGREVFDNEELWSMLAQQVQAGKIRHLGISVGHKDMEASEYQTERASDLGAETIQVVYNRLDLRPEEKILPDCRAQDLGVLARVPLASGYLSGKYKPGASFGSSDYRTVHSREESDTALKEAQRIRREEVPEGIPMAAWALAWCLKNQTVSCVIPGCKSVKQVRDNAAAADLELE